MSGTKGASITPPRDARAMPDRARVDSADPAHVPQSAASPMPRSIDSASLLAGADELHITHGEVRYRLKRTALGKLILTK